MASSEGDLITVDKLMNTDSQFINLIMTSAVYPEPHRLAQGHIQVQNNVA